MFRYGHSWPTGNGGRSWVSGPLWLWPFLWFGQGLWLVLVGWWLWPVWLAVLAAGWLVVQALLLLVSLAWALWALWVYTRYRRRFFAQVRWLTPYWVIIDQVEHRP